jgi:hypothetical protein
MNHRCRPPHQTDAATDMNPKPAPGAPIGPAFPVSLGSRTDATGLSPLSMGTFDHVRSSFARLHCSSRATMTSRVVLAEQCARVKRWLDHSDDWHQMLSLTRLSERT